MLGTRIKNQLRQTRPGNIAPKFVQTCGKSCIAAFEVAKLGMTWLTQPVTSKTNMLVGDRDIEWSFVAVRLGRGPGRVLDFGPGGSALGLAAAQAGYEVVSLDRMLIAWPYAHPGLHYVQGDILEVDLKSCKFDLVLNCSTVEHVGIPGRYDVSIASPEADLSAMARLLDLCKPSGAMLLTIPVGQDAVFAPLHRVYGRNRLPRLLAGWDIQHSEYWTKKDAQSQWAITTENVALDTVPAKFHYGLGLFVLQKPMVNS